MPDTTHTTTPAPTFNNDDHQDADIFGHDWWKKSLWIIGGVVALSAIVFICWLVFRGGDTSATNNSTILPIAAFVMLLAIGAIIALVVSFLLNRRSISAGKVIGVIGGVLAIMFLFVLIAYIFPGFGRAMGFSTPAPANTAVTAVDPNTPPAPPVKRIEKTKWVEKEVFILPHLDSSSSVADFVPSETSRNFKWRGTGSWCGGTLSTNGGCSGLWHGLTGQERNGQLEPIRGKSYPVSTGAFGIDNLIITAEEPEIEVIDNPDYIAHCAKYDNCIAEESAS